MIKDVRFNDMISSNGVFTDGDWIESKDQDPAGEVRLIQLADIGVGKFINKSNRFMTSGKADDLGCTFLEPGDILIARMPDPIARACIFPDIGQKCVTVVDVCVVRVDQEIVDQSWLTHFINSNSCSSQIQKWITGTTRQRISRGNLAKVEIPLPPLAEQKRIAAILDKADAIRHKREKAIELTDTLLKSVFLDMFGDPVTNPKGWDVIAGADVFTELRYGTSQKCSSVQSTETMPILRIPNILNEEINLKNLKYAKLEDADTRKIELQHGDILFVRSNGNPKYIGRCAVFESNLVCGFASYLIRARLDKTHFANPKFLRNLISFPTYRSKLVREARTTAGNYNISTVGLKNLKFIAPPQHIQVSYLELHDILKKRMNLLTQLLSNAENLLASLTQRAFRGELTAKDLDEIEAA